jgi:hypothetical protein
VITPATEKAKAVIARFACPGPRSGDRGIRKNKYNRIAVQASQVPHDVFDVFACQSDKVRIFALTYRSPLIFLLSGAGGGEGGETTEGGTGRGTREDPDRR